MATWRKRIEQEWKGVTIVSVEAPADRMLRVGETFPVRVIVNLGTMSPEDVEVQLCHGPLDATGQIARTTLTVLAPAEPAGSDHTSVYTNSVRCSSSGQFGFCVRVLPKHPNLPHLFVPGFVVWG